MIYNIETENQMVLNHSHVIMKDNFHLLQDLIILVKIFFCITYFLILLMNKNTGF